MTTPKALHLASEPTGIRAAYVPNRGFARLFPDLPPQDTTPDKLAQLAEAIKDDQDAQGKPFPQGDHPTIPAGYTYLGQFIDHDLTLDTTPLRVSQVDVETLPNFRSPAFDLDCLFGRGRSVDAHLYEGPFAGPNRAGRLRVLGMAEPINDLPRLGAPDNAPLIPDGRNDENLVIGQFHTAMINLYNQIFDGVVAGTLQAPALPADAPAADKAAQLLRWHYQWVVRHDFLPRLVQADILQAVDANGSQHFDTSGGAFIPVEFASAAYRLGHSMVRENYHVNGNFTAAGLVDLFSFSSSGGGVPVPPIWLVNLNRFFPLDTGTAVNPARKFDPYVAPTLFNLPGVPPVPGVPNSTSLPARNLIRGWMNRLPSGQAVAAALGIPALSAAEILADSVGQRFKESAVVESLNYHVDTPLWYYILKEAQVRTGGLTLGPVGSTILSEVFLGLLRTDPGSYVSVMPDWVPTLPSATPGTFTASDLLALLPAAALNPVGGDTGPL